MMDCDTNRGIEADFSLVKSKQFVGGGRDHDREQDRSCRTL